MTEVVDRAGGWILTHELCANCGCPSWDVEPLGVAADRWTCKRCGHVHSPSPRTGPILLEDVPGARRIKEDARVGFAIVGQLLEIRPHPAAERLEIIRIDLGFPVTTDHFVPPDRGLELVSGKHYREGDLGIWLRPGSIIPGWLARQLWLPVVEGKFEVREIEMHGVLSPGVWAGEWYRNDRDRPSKLNSKARAQGADHEVDGWLHWGPFAPEWTRGDVVDHEFGIVSATAGGMVW